VAKKKTKTVRKKGKKKVNTDLQERLSRIESLRKELSSLEKTSAKDIMDMLKETMVQHPLLAGIRWQQYTPGFNDGEPCTFGVHGPYFKFHESLGEDKAGYNDDGWVDDYEINKEFFEKKKDILNFETIAELKNTVEAVQVVYGKLSNMETALEAMFGDGYEITVTATGVEAESYDHD